MYSNVGHNGDDVGDCDGVGDDGYGVSHGVDDGHDVSDDFVVSNGVDGIGDSVGEGNDDGHIGVGDSDCDGDGVMNGGVVSVGDSGDDHDGDDNSGIDGVGDGHDADGVGDGHGVDNVGNGDSAIDGVGVVSGGVWDGEDKERKRMRNE